MTVQINIEIVRRETAKAILIACEVETTGRRVAKEVWFPKSQTKVVDNTLHCPDWLAAAKLEEIFGGNAAGTWFN